MNRWIVFGLGVVVGVVGLIAATYFGIMAYTGGRYIGG